MCIDTNIVIWGIRKECRKGQEDRIPRAEQLLDDCLKADLRIIIPTLVLGELLIGPDDIDADRFVQEALTDFMIHPYDFPAAKTFGKIWRARYGEQRLLEKTRQELRADCMIVATAASLGCECIYSNDAGVHGFAKGFINAQDLPPLRPAQKELGLPDKG